MGVGEWLGVAGVALAVVALPTVFQMLAGRPKIEFGFSEILTHDTKLLRIEIRNRPVSNAFLKFLGVRRDSAHITSGYTVVNAATGQKVVGLTNPQIVVGDIHARAVELPAGILVAQIGVAYAKAESVSVLEDSEVGGVFLPPGNYLIPLVVFCGEKSFVARKEFVVTQNPLGTYWVV